MRNERVASKDNIDETMYFPRENGAFSLPEDRVFPFSTLIVKKGRKLHFKPNHQIFMHLVESTANVDSMTAAREKWGQDMLIVTHDGLRIENSPATQGPEN